MIGFNGFDSGEPANNWATRSQAATVNGAVPTAVWLKYNAFSGELEKRKMGMERILETARVRLRPLTESDLLGYQRLLTIPAVAAANGSPADVSSAQIQRWLAADRQSPFAFTIEDKSTQRFMGTILFYQHQTDTGAPSDDAYDLGYFLDPVDWGQGLMPEALAGSLLLVQRAKQRPQTVWATCLVTNHRSQRVLEKLGFTVVLPHFEAPTIGGHAATPERLYRLDLLAEKN